MEFRVLGPIEVYSDDSLVHVGGVKQRSILALMIARHGQVVSADRIVDEVYGDDAAAGARRSVQSIVSMLRRELGDVIVGTGDGYVFDAPREAVDVCRFEDGVAAGLDMVGSDPQRAAAVLWEALGLWRGEPYSGVDGRGVFEVEAARLSELRFVALEGRLEADLVCGRHREVVGELEALVAEYPLRERLWGLWMLGLYRSGRQADALAAYQRLRVVLGEGLGLEPSDELRLLENQILLHDPDLDLVVPVPHNLPASLTSFVGRDLEVIEVGELVAERRLVTLTGPGGSGKTRLAVESARMLLDDFADGVWFVDFRGVDSAGVASLVASTLGVVASGDAPVVDQVVDAVWSLSLLLILDNCEHVLDGVAGLVATLVGRDGAVRVLVTSREPLGVPGELVTGVHPLPVPNRTDGDDLAESAAAMLFVDRAHAAMPEFALDEHLASVVDICRSVEGLPLGLELAAARLRVFAPEELVVHLDDQLATLKIAQRSGDLRHATMDATIRWSWELLNDWEQTLLGRLSVFRGTWSLTAARAVCGFDAINVRQVVDLVASLVDKSLVTVARAGAGPTRYRLLEPIRQYATYDLDDEETAALRSRITDYWAELLAGSYDPDVRFAWRDHERARELEVDQANLTAAVEFALASGRFEDAMVIFASPFGDLLVLQGSHFATAIRWAETAVKHRDTVSPGVSVAALEVVGSIAWEANRFDAAVRYAHLGIEVSRTPEERRWFELAAAMATARLDGHSEMTKEVFTRVGDQADRRSLRASALIAEAVGNKIESGWALTQEAIGLLPADSPMLWDECRTAFYIFDLAEDWGHYDLAKRMAERSLDLSRRFGWLRMESQTAGRLACLCADTGRIEEASTLIREAVPVARRIVGPTGSANQVLEFGARVARLQGDLAQARCLIAEARRAVEKLDILWPWLGISIAVESALINRDDEDLDEAVRLLHDASLLLGDLEQPDFLPYNRAMILHALASVEVRRGDPDRALEHLLRVLKDFAEITHLQKVVAVDLLAVAVAQQGRSGLAARLKGSVDRERDNCGLVVQPPDVPVREAAMSHARSLLESGWDDAVNQGRSLTLAEAANLVLAETAFTAPTELDPRNTITDAASTT